MVDPVTAEGYRPPAEYEEDCNEANINISMTDSTELWLLKLPYSNDFFTDIDGQELTIDVQNDGQLASFESSSGKKYDFVSSAAQEPDETLFIPSATEPKIARKISRRVSTVHFADPKELENRSSTKAGQGYRNSSGLTGTTSSRYFPMRSGKSSLSGPAASSKGSRQKSSVSEVTDPSAIRKRVSKSTASGDISNATHARGHSTGISSMSSDHSHGAKSKRRKQKE